MFKQPPPAPTESAIDHCPTMIRIVGWLVAFGFSWLFGCFGLNGPLRQYFSLYRAISQTEGERKEK